MGWGIANGIGWPNASAYSGPPPATEKYLVSDCIGYYSDFTSTAYPVGTFQVNDRVYYNDGDSSFGLIDSISEGTSLFPIYPTGINTGNCFDNSINFGAYNDINEHYFVFIVELESADTDFVSIDDQYPMNVPYYNSALVLIYVDNPDGGYYDDISVSFSGELSLDSYNFYQGTQEIIVRSQQITNAFYPIEVISFSEQFISLSPYFYNIESYNVNGENCNPHYFLRTNGTEFGTTFSATWRNDYC